MSELNIDLTKQEYQVFDTKDNRMLSLKPINIIFGKNGSGKSTLADLIKQQMEGEEDFNVYIFRGIDDLLIDNKLNGIVLGDENRDIKTSIAEIDRKINNERRFLNELTEKVKSLKWRSDYKEQGIEKSREFINLEKCKEEYKRKKELIEEFYTYGAKMVREYSLSSKLSVIYYNKNNFKNEIIKRNRLSDDEISKCIDKITDKPKDQIAYYTPYKHDYMNLSAQVEAILNKEPKQLEILEEALSNPEKKNFAMKGLEIHLAGEVCAFCGNIYTAERKEKLDIFFSQKDFGIINEEIQRIIELIYSFEQEIKNFKLINKSDFYNFLHDDISEINKIIKEKIDIIIMYLENLKYQLDIKRKDIFSSMSLNEIDVPDSINIEIKKINDLIRNHNSFCDNYKDKQEIAREKLRYHIVNEIVENRKDYYFKEHWEGYISEIKNLENLEYNYQSSINIIDKYIESICGNSTLDNKNTLYYRKTSINQMEIERRGLLALTQNTEHLANSINDKLASSGKSNLKLKVSKLENEVECYVILNKDNKTRDVTKISTGEKNIIGFLYFIGYLKSLNNHKRRIIIFDDPMTSNDDTFQYLMITELQKIYRERGKLFNKNKDIFICMTHNVHFYLNIQPHGDFEDKNGHTKYDKNNFYIIRNNSFCKVNNTKEDFKTSYEALWMELNDLYNEGYVNSMLNSMRRIIETFIKFNKINQESFYKDRDEHIKLFNVNSHEAVDEFSADSVGKTKDEILYMFKDLFIKNGFQNHLSCYWKD